MLAVGDDQSDVGEQRPGLQVVTARIAQSVNLACLVEQLTSEARHRRRVGEIVIAPLGELLDSATAGVEQRMRVDPRGTLEGVEQDALTECVVAEDEALDAEHRSDTLQDQCS